MFQVGQKLWYVSSQRRGDQREVTVEKVGRIWTYVGYRMRIDATGRVDGGDYMSPGHCYPSREVYEAEQARKGKWDRLRCKVRDMRLPTDMTIEKMSQIEQLLGIVTI